MRIKAGVRLAGMRPEMVIGLMICESVYAAHGHDMVLTEGTGGKHGPGTLHHEGLASDLRLPSKCPPLRLALSWPPVDDVIVALQEALGSEFDVVLETDHIHVEWQPVLPPSMT